MIQKILRKITRILMILVILFIAGGLIYLGFYFVKVSKKSYIYSSCIDQVFNKVEGYLKSDSKYFLGDDFSVNGTIDIDLNSEDYDSRSLLDEEYLKKKNEITNISNLDITYQVKQDRSHKQLFLSYQEKLEDEDILLAKYLVQDSTKYFFVKDVVDHYVNDGTNNYFEMFHDKITTKDNMTYILHSIRDALKNSITEEQLSSYETEINVGNDRVKAEQISYKITDKEIKRLHKAIMKELKNDERSYTILTGIDPDFFKHKIDEDKVFLNSNESYTFHIYRSKVLSKPLKYELVYLKDDHKEIYTYEGSFVNGTFYYSVDDNVKYSAMVRSSDKRVDIIVSDLKDDVGSIKLEKDRSNLMFTLTLHLEDKKYDVVYSYKYKDYVRKKSYVREDTLAFKFMDQMVVMMNGDVKAISKVSKGAKISEDISTSILKSTLSEEENNQLENLKDSVKERLQEN